MFVYEEINGINKREKQALEKIFKNSKVISVTDYLKHSATKNDGVCICTMRMNKTTGRETESILILSESCYRAQTEGNDWCDAHAGQTSHVQSSSSALWETSEREQTTVPSWKRRSFVLVRKRVVRAALWKQLPSKDSTTLSIITFWLISAELELNINEAEPFPAILKDHKIVTQTPNISKWHNRRG